MDIKNTQKAKIFTVKKPDWSKVPVATISTYEGKGVDGEAKYSNWLARVVGKEAKEKLKDLKKDKAGCNIVLTNAKIETWYNKDKGQGGYSMTIFDFDIDTSNKGKKEESDECIF